MFGKGNHISSDKKHALFLKIRPVLVQRLEISEDKITLSSKLVEELGADSLDAIEIIMDFEEMFKIEILDTEAEGMKTVEDIVVYLAKRLNTNTR